MIHEEKLLELARDAYRASTTFVDSYLRQQWERNIKQWQSRHDSQSRYSSDFYKGRSRLFRPRTRAVVRKNEASVASAFFSTNDAVNILPQNDNDELDELTAEILTSILNYRLNNTIPWFHTLVGGYQSAQIYGQVCSYQHWEYNKEKGIDEPKIKLIPIENMRIDPAADWIDPINSSPYVIELIPMYIGDIKAKMGKIDPKTNEPVWRPADAKILTAAQGEYYDSTRVTRENREDSKQNYHAVETDYSTAWVRRNIIKLDDEDWFFYSLGQEHMLTKPKLLSEVSVLKKRPYVMGYIILEAHKNYPAGTPELTRDIQNEINNICNQRLDNVKLAMDKRYFIKRGKQVDIRSITRNIPGSATLMDDPLNDVVVHETRDVTASSFAEQDRLNLEFDDLAGTFSGSSVQANRKLNETVGGMNLMSQGANQLAEYQLRTFIETWVEPVLKQLCELIIAYETDDVFVKYGSVQPEALQDIEFALSGEYKVNVNVGTGATNPQTQVERFFYGLNSLAGVLGESFVQQVDVEEIVKETFGKLGYKDGIRFFNFNNPEIDKLLQQIQQLKQQLEQKQNPIELEAKIEKLKAETEKIKAETTVKNVEGMYSSLQGAQTVATVPQVAPIADEIYKSAGGEDKNGFPLTGQQDLNQQVTVDQPQNTDPRFPANPQSPSAAMMHGIETQANDALEPQ